MAVWQDRLLVGAFGPEAQGGASLQWWVGSIGIAVVVGVVYFLAAQLGLALLTNEERVAVFWPASGIAAGTLIALGRWARMPVAAGVIAASVAANILGDRSLWGALAFGLCNAGEALLVVWLIERWFGPAFNLDSLRRVVGFFAAAAIATATTAAGAAVAMKIFGPSTAALLDVWKVWFASDALGVVTIAPLLIGVAAAVRDAPSWRELLEGTLAVVVLTAVISVLLAVLSGPWSLIAPSAFYFPLLLWLVSRCHPVFAAAAVFTITGAIVWTTTHDIGRYGDPTQPIAIRVLAAQITLLSTALAALALAALFAERRKHEATIAERDAQLALAGKTALVGTYVLNVNTGRAEFSAGYAAIHGLPGATEEGWRDEWMARVHPDDRARLDALRNKTFAERQSEHRSEYRILRPDGALRWIEGRAFVSYDDDGRAQRMIGVNIDITDRKRAEAALELSEARYHALFDDNPSMYFTLDTAGTVLSVNQFGARQLGYAPAELVGQSVLRVVHEDDWEAARQHLARCAQKPETVARTELRKVRRDGSILWVREVARSVQDPQGQTVVLIVCEDFTDLKRAEDHQKLLVAELDHRVKNVLATVAAVARDTSEHSGSMSEFVDALDRRIRSMADAHALLSKTHWLGVSLADLVRQELAPYAAAGNTIVEGPDMWLTPAATQTMAMVLHELATNAAKYGAFSVPQGRVSVCWDLQSNGNAPARLRLQWREEGGPVVATPGRSGYGTSVIQELIPYELGGTVELEYRENGVHCAIQFAIHSDADRLGNSAYFTGHGKELDHRPALPCRQLHQFGRGKVV